MGGLAENVCLVHINDSKCESIGLALFHCLNSERARTLGSPMYLYALL